MKAPRLLLAGATALCLLAGHASAQSIEGEYRCHGSDANGGNPYSGTVTLAKDGPVYAMNWELGKGGDYVGTALLVNGRVLAGAYGGGKPYGLVIYQVNGGVLSGQWLVGGRKGLGQETIQGAAELGGVYQITSAKNPEGKDYKGTVTITENGGAYAVNWTLANESYSGVGILHGDLFVVGRGQGANYGAVVYDVENGRLTGEWAAAGSGPLGVEKLVRK